MNRYSRPGTATSIKDRTREFRAAVDTYRRGSTAGADGRHSRSVGPLTSSSIAGATPYRPRTEFTKLAANIGRDIQGTARKLERLGVLAKRRTLFDDKPEEITSLTMAVKQDIALINQKIAALQRYAQEQRQRHGGGGNTTNQAKEHDQNVVVFLQSKLASTSMDFKNILEVRSENIRASNSRREQFMDGGGGGEGSPSLGGGGNGPSSGSHRPPHLLTPADRASSPLYLTQRRPASGTSLNAVGRSSSQKTSSYPPAYEAAPPLYANESEDFVSLSVPDALGGNESQQQQQQLLLQEQDSQYMDSRSNAIQSIESTIAELGGIFQQLAHMVAEQRDVVQRIDANVEDIEMNVTGAQQELLKYYSYVSSNRWLMLKIFAIIIVFVTLFILVM
ncbi:Integral membrane protein SED5 [Tieghemiomyces parasiticus]|uniref:Integral membrane protein SED5 n=1 Tax=Tieghemiomyces parasiticus TaxID=78921 RepID=A0A9W8DSW3_9FUNG|nr:Integral membrane protein SED5 [Tieghemiomyces parasiticus]